MSDNDDLPIDQRFTQVDREIRRAQLEEKIRALGGMLGRAGGDDAPASDLELAFMEHVLAWETGPSSKHREWLARHGLVFPPPEEVDARQLKQELWRLVESLATVARVFLYHTNHLSDAELYAYLWRDVLEVEAPDVARTADDACHHDFADWSTGDPEDERIWLTFYASEEERREHVRHFPQTVLPPRRCAPWRRDHRLPVRT